MFAKCLFELYIGVSYLEKYWQLVTVFTGSLPRESVGHFFKLCQVTVPACLVSRDGMNEFIVKVTSFIV